MWQAGAVVQRRLVGGVGTRETKGCENVLCVRRRALLGGDGGVEEREEVDIAIPIAAAGEFGFRSLNCLPNCINDERTGMELSESGRNQDLIKIRKNF